MHLTPVVQFVVAGSWRSIHARCWSFAIGSRTRRRAGTILSGCGGRKDFAARLCSGPDHWVTERGLRHCRGCSRQTSVTAGTLFADTHLPLRLWFEALWHVTGQKSGGSALGLQRVLGLGSYRTAWNLLHKLRRAMVRPGRERASTATPPGWPAATGFRRPRRLSGRSGADTRADPARCSPSSRPSAPGCRSRWRRRSPAPGSWPAARYRRSR
jgi:hypothetical protein